MSKQNKPVDAVYSIIHHHYHVCTLRMACRSVQWRRRVVSSSFFSWYLYVSARISGYLMRSFLLLLLRNSSLHSKTTTSQVQGKILGSANIIYTPPPPCCGDYVTITLPASGVMVFRCNCSHEQECQTDRLTWIMVMGMGILCIGQGQAGLDILGTPYASQGDVY